MRFETQYQKSGRGTAIRERVAETREDDVYSDNLSIDRGGDQRDEL